MTPPSFLPKRKKREPDINQPVDLPGWNYDRAVAYPPMPPLQEDTLRRYEPLKKIRRGLRNVKVGNGGRQGNQGTL